MYYIGRAGLEFSTPTGLMYVDVSITENVILSDHTNML